MDNETRKRLLREFRHHPEARHRLRQEVNRRKRLKADAGRRADKSLDMDLARWLAEGPRQEDDAHTLVREGELESASL